MGEDEQGTGKDRFKSDDSDNPRGLMLYVEDHNKLMYISLSKMKTHVLPGHKLYFFNLPFNLRMNLGLLSSGRYMAT